MFDVASLKKPSDALVRHMAALRSLKMEEIDAQDLLDEWELPGEELRGLLGGSGVRSRLVLSTFRQLLS